MATGINSLLDISRRALYANSQALQVISNNVANVNTEGYTRRQIVLEEANSADLGQTSLGEGVEVSGVRRVTDPMLQNELQNRVMDRSSGEARSDLLSRAENVFSVGDDSDKIGTSLQEFFSSIQDLEANPADSALRSAVLEKGQALTTNIRDSYNSLASLQREADTNIQSDVTDINNITSKIASLNAQMAGHETGSQENLTLRDSRDKLLQDLAEKVSYKVLDTGNGMVNVTLANGFSLVDGTNARSLTYTTSPTLSGGATYPAGLDGSKLGSIVYDFDSSSSTDAQLDLTSELAQGGGEVAGLLNFRGVQSTTDTTPFDAKGDVVDLAARVEVIARDLLTRGNQLNANSQPSGTGYVSESYDLNGNSPIPFGMFSFDAAATRTDKGDADLDGRASQHDLTLINSPNYAGQLTFAISDPSKIAASQTVGVTGDGKNLKNLEKLGNEAMDDTGLNIYGGDPPTLNDSYDQTVTLAGVLSNSASAQYQSAKDRETQVQTLKDSVSGVNLDEEFSKLISFQRSYQAAARLIKAGDDMLGEIINMAGQ